MAFWGIEVKPGKPFTLKFDDGLRRRLHISQATLAIGSSKLTSLVQCNVGNKSPVLLCALLPNKSESLQLNLEFDENEEVLFSVIGPRGVHLTGFYTAGGHNFNDDQSESYGEDIANSENEESVPQSDEDEYEDSFIDDDDDDNLEVSPLSPVLIDGVDDIDKRRNKRNTSKQLKKSSQVIEVIESDDDSISWQLGSCIRSVLKRNTSKQLKKKSQVIESDDDSISCQQTGSLESDDEDKFRISSLLKNKKPAKNNVSEFNAGDASIPKGDSPVKIDNPNRTTPKKKSKVTASEGKTLEADASIHRNAGDEAEQSEAKTNYTAVGLDPIVTNETNDDPDMNKTIPKEKSKGSASEGKTLKADAAIHSIAGDEAKQSEAKTNYIAVGLDPIVTNEIDDNPGVNQTTPKKKSKGVSNEVKILEADAANHVNSDDKAKTSEAKTNDIAVSQDPFVTNEIDIDPGTKGSNLLSPPKLNLESVAKPKKKRKERSKEEKIPKENTDNHIKNFQEKKYLLVDTKADDMDQDLHVRKERDQNPFDNTETGLSADTLLPTVEEGSEKPKKKRRRKEQDLKTFADNGLDVPERKADENTSKKAAKKKENKIKRQKNDEIMDTSSKGNKENPINAVQEKNVFTGSSQGRTLSNGLVIEDLESSKSDGKVAAPGRKLKIKYTAKLKENGEIIDSNGQAPYRFRLGDEDVMEGWNIGLDGMQAGDKRRLVVPPSLCNGNKGTAENIPPQSWVIYDVELLSVR